MKFSFSRVLPGMRSRRLLLCFVLLTWARSTVTAWADEPLALPAPTAANFSTILSNQSNTLSIFAYNGRKNITLFDFPSLVEQGRMFNRIVAMVERIGAPRTRVLSNEELSQFIRSVGKTEATLAYGNDLLISELVVFFNLSEHGNIQLNAQEIALRQFLLDQRLITFRTGFFQALLPNAVILSLPQENQGTPGSPAVTALARRTILAHEHAHAEYYTNPIYANFCLHFWRSVLNDTERDAFRKFLARRGYNSDNEEMMLNEAQAYLMHTPDARAFSPDLIGLKAEHVNTLRQKFRQGFPDMPYL